MSKPGNGSLETIVRSIIAPSALDVDLGARFPRVALDALGKAGLLGLLSACDVGGMGLGLADAAQVVERIAEDCPSTATVLMMHYVGASLIERHGPLSVREAIGEGRHITTLAWSETGSRSHFWAPFSTARADGEHVVLNGGKSMVTSAQEADSYIWSTQPLDAEGSSTLWLIDTCTPGLSSPKPFDGLGLRGNASAPVRADNVRVPKRSILGGDGEGGALMQNDALPVFAMLNASASIGLMQGSIRRAIAHLTSARFAESGATLADLPTIRAYLARARIRAVQARAVRDDTLAAMTVGRADTLERVLANKASAAEAALEVTDIAMRICGGAAFRKELGIDRLFRDARASSVMAPTSDVLFDLIGRLLCGMPLS
jgi:alkylation response protein AidB-like acyl-CoA dehydrogenase